MPFEILWSKRAQDHFRSFSDQDRARILKALRLLSAQEGPIPRGLVKVHSSYHAQWGIFQGRAGREIRYFLSPLGGHRYTLTAVVRRSECPVNDSER